MSSERGVETLPAHIRGFALMHVAMRRDARRLLAAAPAVRPGNAPTVGSWWRQLNDIIDWHHQSEDDVLWPELRRRVPDFTAKEQALNGDHEALDHAMAAVSTVLVPGGDLGALPAAAARFDDIIHEHLRLEEAVVFPVFTSDLTVEEYLAIERRVIGTAPVSVMTVLQPWMFDGVTGRATSTVAATIPPPVRLLGNTVLRWRYQRLVSPVVALA
jgi:hypothetical protein